MATQTDRTHVIVGIVLAVVSTALLTQARNLPVVNPYGAANAAFWPSIILVALTLISILYVFFGGGGKPTELKAEPDEPPNYKRLLIVCALIVALPLLSLWIGFLLASFIIIPALMLAFGERDKKYLTIVPIASVAGIYFIFIEAMSLGLSPRRGDLLESERSFLLRCTTTEKCHGKC